MTAEKYVQLVGKKLKCSGAKRREIRRQLLDDISAEQAGGVQIEQIIGRMGTPAEVAKEFNENMSDEELKKFSRTKTFKIAGIIAGVIAVVAVLLFVAVFWLLPTSYEFGSSGLFEEDAVKAQLQVVVEKVGEGDYEYLKNISSERMKKGISDDVINKVKNQISDDWGNFNKYGNIYLFEMKQQGSNYVVGQVNVTYENVVVTYTITFNKDMKLDGIYLK